MTDVLVAFIGAVALIGAAAVPVLLSNRRTRAHGSDVLAAIHRVEGEVAGVRDDVRALLAWKGAHDASHEEAVSAPPKLAVVAPAGRPRRARRV